MQECCTYGSVRGASGQPASLPRQKAVSVAPEADKKRMSALLGDSAGCSAVGQAFLPAFGLFQQPAKGSHRIYLKGGRRVVIPFHSSATLHPKIVKQVLEAIEEASPKPRPPG